MNDIIRFILKWFIPIGFVELITKTNDNLLSKDSVGKQTYWRLSEAKKPLKGAGILIRRT